MARFPRYVSMAFFGERSTMKGQIKQKGVKKDVKSNRRVINGD